MRAVLGRLGVKTNAITGYESQIGITLNNRTPLVLESKNLLVSAADPTSTPSSALPDLSSDAASSSVFQSMAEMLAQPQADLNITEGDLNMWQAEPPASSPPAIYVAAKATAVGSVAKPHKLGVCKIVLSESEDITPRSDANDYMHAFTATGVNFYKSPGKPLPSDLKVEIIQSPRFGTLEQISDEGLDKYNYRYTPSASKTNDDGHKDKFVVKVSAGGESVTIYYTVAMFVGHPSSFIDEKGVRRDHQFDQCPGDRSSWKISQSDFNPGTQDYAAWLRSSELSTLLANASQSLTGFQDLAGSAVGNTVGEGANAAITLDFTAAGHNWYIDPTPLDNTDDYLPTSNPNVWQAKAGTGAAGKMDMLSVLLHEYGHALGLEHSADSGDYMAATLQPGQRRLPSSEELTLMSQLVAQLKASTTWADGSAPLNPSAPLGALLIGRLALGRRPEDEGANALGTSQALSQALFSANPTLQGGSLATLLNWSTQGSVTPSPTSPANASSTAGATLAVNLSFDLIGFGNTPASTGSHVQVSDVRLLGLPQAADDSVSTPGDTPVAIKLVAADSDFTRNNLQFVIQPQNHGFQRVPPHKGSTHTRH